MGIGQTEMFRENIYLKWIRFIENGTKELVDRHAVNAQKVHIDDEDVKAYEGLSVPAYGVWHQREGHKITCRFGCDRYDGIDRFSFQGDYVKGELHLHKSVEIGYVVKGCARQSFYGKTVEFHEGDFWLVDPDCYHQDIYGPEELLTIFFSISLEEMDRIVTEEIEDSEILRFFSLAMMRQKKARQYIHFVPRADTLEAEITMDQLIQELSQRKTGYKAIVNGLLQRLTKELVTNYDFLVDKKEKKKLRDLMHVEMKKYIAEHCDSVTLQNLCSQFHYNRDYFNRLLREYEGMTYSEYLRVVRTKRACELLEQTDLTVEDVAEIVGYRSRSHFYDMFLEQMGVSPAEYRKTKKASVHAVRNKNPE